MLRNGSDALGGHFFPVDPLFSTSISMGGGGSADTHQSRLHHILSTDGSNSLSTNESGNGNGNIDTIDTIDDTTVLVRVRPCACFEQSGFVHENKHFVALCPESSECCGLTRLGTSTVCWHSRKVWQQQQQRGSQQPQYRQVLYRGQDWLLRPGSGTVHPIQFVVAGGMNRIAI